MEKINQSSKDNKKLVFAQVKIMEFLYNQMHNDWVNLNSCGKVIV